LGKLIALAHKGIAELVQHQQAALLAR
jgi:hypothetical protein